MVTLKFVTGNKSKAQSTQRILDFPITIKDIELEEIQETDLEKIALHKIKEAVKKVGAHVIIDDVGLYIKAWNDFPGPLIKWILKAGDGKATILLKMLEKEKNREAIARLAVVYHDGKTPHVFYGEIEGRISTEIRGANGFGWDAVFIPRGYNKTFAEMSFEEKDSISHRRKALDKLRDFLKRE